jgi:putative membrane protein
MPHDYLTQWHMWWVFPMFMPIFWLIVVAVILYLIFGRRGPQKPWQFGQDSQQETALDILKKRYAKGEISQEEFERIKRDIS